MNKANNNTAAIEQFLNALQAAFAQYYREAISRNVKAGIQAKKLRLLSKAK